MASPALKSDGYAQYQNDIMQAARINFASFVETFFDVLHPDKKLDYAPYMDLIFDVLRNSRKGGSRRIIFNLPPGFMKSMLVSVFYTAWRLGVNPGEKIICISYGDDLCHELSRRTRMLMQHPLYRKTFPNTVLDKKSEDSITTTLGGQRYATAVGSDIAGFRADTIIIDDPMQPDDGYSESAKAKLRNWYFGVVSQRLLDQGKGVIILVMHRIAPDDFSQTLVDSGSWAHYSLQLIAETNFEYHDPQGKLIYSRKVGDPLNETRMAKAACEELRETLLEHVFSAQYQQRPLYEGSGNCTIGRLVRYDTLPKPELTIHSWDIAATKNGGDYTVCTKFAISRVPDVGDVAFLTGIVRMQVELPDVRSAITLQDAVDKPSLILMDGNGIGRSVYQDLYKTSLGSKLFTGGAMEKANADGLKAKRFQHALMNLYDGRVRIPNAFHGLDGLLHEFAVFPNGKHDDQVDSLCLVAAYLERVIYLARQRKR